MNKAKSGDTVRVNYASSFYDGTVFDTSKGKEPLQFTIGEKQLIPSFKTAVERLTPGEKITTKIPANKAHSPLREDMIFVIHKSSFPEGISPKIG